MKIKLDYGEKGLEIDLKDADVLKPNFQDPIINIEETIVQKLYKPDFGKGLEEILKNKKTVAISHTDITRATPNNIIIPILIKEIINCGIKKEDIVLINMTGSHREQTKKELEVMLGKEIVENFRCIQHNSFDKSTLSFVGNMEGNHPLYINKEFFDADVKICTGFIEPHFFAGFSGGPKAILPGLCDIDTIMRNHNAERIGSENAIWKITEGNPVWENMREGARLVNPDMLFNVALNTKNQISGVFIGEWEKTHKKGYQFVKKNAMIKVNKLYDIVITTNSGYPLDMNLYQCVKGISGASQITKENGTIIIAGECSDGIPFGSHYDRILKMENTPEKLFDRIIKNKEVIPEQWQVQVQTKIQKRAKVYVYSDFLTDKDLKNALLMPCRDIEKLVSEIGGDVAVIPQGPQAIPYYEED